MFEERIEAIRSFARAGITPDDEVQLPIQGQEHEAPARRC